MKRVSTNKGWAGAMALALLAAGPAGAQIAQNSNAPVDITADELEVVNAQCVAIWRGSAEALQADSRLRADVLKIYNRAGPAKPGGAGPTCAEVARMEAQGNVYYVTPQQRVHGDAATYDASAGQIVVSLSIVVVLYTTIGVIAAILMLRHARQPLPAEPLTPDRPADAAEPTPSLTY